MDKHLVLTEVLIQLLICLTMPRDYINSVSRNDIQKFAQSFLNVDALTFIVVGQPTGLDNTNAPFVGGF